MQRTTSPSVPTALASLSTLLVPPSRLHSALLPSSVSAVPPTLPSVLVVRFFFLLPFSYTLLSACRIRFLHRFLCWSWASCALLSLPVLEEYLFVTPLSKCWRLWVRVYSQLLARWFAYSFRHVRETASPGHPTSNSGGATTASFSCFSDPLPRRTAGPVRTRGFNCTSHTHSHSLLSGPVFHCTLHHVFLLLSCLLGCCSCTLLVVPLTT